MKTSQDNLSGSQIIKEFIEPMPVAQAASCDTNIRYVNFSGVVGKDKGVTANIRTAPSLSAAISRVEPNNKTLSFDAWGYGDTVNDLWENLPDARWFKLKGENLWVASAIIYGLPPGNPSRLPSCGGGVVDLAGLQKLLYGNVHSNVTSPYGYRNCEIWARFYRDCQHPALDIAGLENTPIYSPVNGVVIRTNPNDGGVWIYNQHSDITFLFLHMNSISIANNSSVAKGQQVGTEGRRGHVTGSHLHFEAQPGRKTGYANDIRQTLNPVDAVNRANN